MKPTSEPKQPWPRPMPPSRSFGPSEARIERERAAAEATCQALELGMKRSDAGAALVECRATGRGRCTR